MTRLCSECNGEDCENPPTKRFGHCQKPCMTSPTPPPSPTVKEQQQEFVYLLSIVNVDSHQSRYICDSEQKARELFEELRNECIEDCRESINRYKEEREYNVGAVHHEEEIIKFLETMKSGDVPPFCCDHPMIEVFPFLRTTTAQPVDAPATRDIIGTKVSPLFVVDAGDIAQIRSALVNAGYSEEYIRKTLECITSSPCNKTDLTTAERKKVIEEILLWRIENRGKKLGYCTNGMIEDQFLTELMGLDCWTPEEYNAKIALAERTRVLDTLRTLALVRLAQGISGLSFSAMVAYLDIEKTDRDISNVCNATGKSLEDLKQRGEVWLAQQQEQEREQGD